jgi:hypothetical protein
VLPDHWPHLQSLWIGAGPVPPVLHRALNALAWLVSWRIVPSLSPLSSLMHSAINVLRWGEHRGGMFVTVGGTSADGTPVERSWHLLAEGNDGPLIPSMACEALIRGVLAGRKPPAGARAATGDLELADYDALFANRTIFTGVRDERSESAPLYRQILGDAYDAMPEPLQRMHNLDGERIAEGKATVERGGNLLARLVAAAMGFPKAGEDIPVRVDFKREGRREIWTRTFSGRRFASTQEEGRGRFQRLLCERFGPFAFGLALVLDGGRLCLVARRWTAFGIPLPLTFAPRGDAHEHAADGRFNFHVEISHPLTGLIVRYQGWLVPRS